MSAYDNWKLSNEEDEQDAQSVAEWHKEDRIQRQLDQYIDSLDCSPGDVMYDDDE